MPLVPAKCTQCGASVEVDDEKEAAICTHCGTAFIVEKAINNYHVTNNVVNHIHADVVNVVEGNIEDYIRNAESAYEFEDYDKMSEMADKILNLDPQNLDGIFYKVTHLVKFFERKEESVVKVLNYLVALTKQEYKISKTKRLAETVVKKLFLDRYSAGTKEQAQKVHEKLISVCDMLEIDPLEYDAINLYDRVKYNEYVKLYIKERFSSESDMDMTNVPKLSQDKDGYKTIQLTKNFIKFYDRYSDTRTHTYYKKAVTLSIHYNGELVYVRAYDKSNTVLTAVWIGYIKFLHNDSKKIAFIYQILKKNGYNIKLSGDNSKCLEKLKSSIGL